MTAAIVIAILGLAITVLLQTVKITRFTTKLEIYVDEMRSERKLVRSIPILEHRIRHLEKHLEISAPSMSLYPPDYDHKD